MKTTALKHKYLSGFTLYELMLTIAVAAVILTLGVPSFQGLMERNQLTANINQFISSLALARSEAIKRNQRVSLCVSSDGATCTGTGYEDGWIVYVDRNSNNSRQPATEELIWVGESLPGNLTLRGDGCCGTDIPYLASGRISGISGSVNLCKDNDVSKSRRITLNSSGRVRLVSGGTGNCATS